VEDPTTPWLLAQMHLPARWVWSMLVLGVAAVMVVGVLLG
jgi:hypothetical protein